MPPPLSVGLIGAATTRGAALRAAGLDTLAGDAALAERCDVVVVEGTFEDRVARVHEVVARGANVFVAWPPAPDVAAAERLAAIAEEAGVEVGVARPLPVAGLLAGRPDGWAARLVAVELVAAADGALAAVPHRHRLAGALDVCAALVGRRALAGLDAEAHAWPHGPSAALALGLRFRNGAYAQVLLRDARHADADAVSVVAAGPSGTLEAASLGGPLCLDGAAPGRSAGPTDDAPGPSGGRAHVEATDEAVAFVHAIRLGARSPFSLHDALATMRLADRVAHRLG